MLSIRRTSPLPEEVPRPPAQICFRERESGDIARMRSASTQAVEVIVAVFSMIPMTCVDSKLATALRLDMAIHNSKPVSWPERLNFPVLQEELCQECSFSFKSGMHVIASCGTAIFSALWTQFALVCGWHKAESAE